METRDLSIRKLAGPAEARVCAELMAGSEPWITLQRGYEESLAMFSDPEREVYVAAAGTEIAGFVILQMRGALVGYLQSVGVAPDWRGRGVGSKLIAFAEKRIFSEAPNVFILVSSFNDRARALYERLGYEVIGELKDYIVAGHSEILLRKSLSPLAAFNRPKGESKAD
jgi:ribosomal protein S18 acetylase RimI-like enzyme